MNFDLTKTNIGTTDRIIRAAVGVLLIIGTLRGGTWIAAAIGALLLATAYVRVCPAYMPFHFSTNKEPDVAVK